MGRTKPAARQLFKHVDGAAGNVVLNFTRQPMSELALIGDVYHRAAKRAVDAFDADNYSDLDAYPIVFLYRHGLELLIKATLSIGNDLSVLLDKPELQVRDLFRDHSLARHIPQLKSLFEAVEWADAFEQAGMAKGEFDRVIAEFERFDPSSITFRYPIKKDGSASLCEKHFVFSPKEFATTLDPILATLFGACIGLEEHRHVLAEAHHEMVSQAYDDYYADYCDNAEYLSDYSDCEPGY